jgi:hypothetical protein
MDIRPAGHPDGKPESAEQIFNHTSIQQDVEEPDNTTPRTKMRMFAIITALFVRQSGRDRNLAPFTQHLQHFSQNYLLT